MAKKRVHEIAKKQGLTSKEVLAALNAAGIEAKAAASSVEEDVALEALKNADGATEATPSEESAAAKKAAPKAPARKRPVRSDGDQTAAPSKPGGKRRRRVVIDSQAARRDHVPQALSLIHI